MTIKTAEEAREIITEIEKLNKMINNSYFKSLSHFSINNKMSNGIGNPDTVINYEIKDERLLDEILNCLRERKKYLIRQLEKL